MMLEQLKVGVEVLLMSLLGATIPAWIWLLLRRRASLKSIETLRKTCEPVKDSISVIIPGRNVERWVERCLSGLLNQRGVNCEIIFVDDSSDDRTGSIVLGKFLERGVRYVRVGEAPEEWVGKSYACWRGFKHSRGEWLLFIDADTVLLDECVLVDALRRCEDGLDVLSLIPLLDTSSLSSKIMLPLLQNIFLSIFQPFKTNIPRHSTAILFGAFILIRRDVYQAIGGHKAVRRRVLEDRALASILKRGGYRILLVEAGGRLIAEFAGSLSGYLQATKRLVADYASTGNISPLKYYIVGAFLLLLLPQVTLIIASISGYAMLAALAISSIGVNLAANIIELNRLRVRKKLLYAPLTLLANWVLVASLIYAAFQARIGRIDVVWRGRRIKA